MISSWTSHSTPADPTTPGTVANCGKYVEIASGSDCNTIVLANGITLDSFYAMNPSINANCTNLLADYDYCVALVNGTSIITSTTTTTSVSGAGSATSTASSTSTFVAAPTQTVTGTTDECYEWYVVQSGDNCYAIYTEYDITFEYFRELNTYIDEACDNLWPDYAYCVNGVVE